MSPSLMCLTIGVGILYASRAEHWLHRHVMHKPLIISIFGYTWIFVYPYKAHAKLHHKMFEADDTYHCINPNQDASKIPMAWWNGPILALIASIPTIPTWWFDWHIWLTFTLTIYGYYVVYEIIHWAMHLQKRWLSLLKRFFPFFRQLNGHHLLHHRYTGKNFNVVLPVWDWILGTLMVRSPKKFCQARGDFVPDVQPMD